MVKNPPASVGHTGDQGSIPGSGRSPGEGNSYPLQYSCLENFMNRGAWTGIEPWAMAVKLLSPNLWTIMEFLRYLFLQISVLGPFWKFTPATTMKGTKQAKPLFCIYQLSHVQIHLIFMKSCFQAPQFCLSNISSEVFSASWTELSCTLWMKSWSLLKRIIEDPCVSEEIWMWKGEAS